MKRNPKIEAICLYCEHATVLQSEADEPSITCKKKKGITITDKCLRFRYDPLKQSPHEKPVVPSLDPNSLLI